MQSWVPLFLRWKARSRTLARGVPWTSVAWYAAGASFGAWLFYLEDESWTGALIGALVGLGAAAWQTHKKD